MKTLLAAGLAAGALLLSASSASGNTSVRGRFLGVVPRQGFSTFAPLARPFAAPLTSTPDGTPMTYHGYDVMTTTTNYTIFWYPTGYTLAASYQSGIDRFFIDVEQDSGLATNVYSVDTQYCQGVAVGATACNGGGTPIQYQSTFGGTWQDTTPFVSHCSAGGSACLVDTDYEAAVTRALAANPTWHADSTSMFFVMTPSGVVSCFDSSGAQCTNSSSGGYCAYHSSFGNAIYAVQPYNASIGGCSTGQYPTGTNAAADDEINTISHESNEAITDPGWDNFNGAWYQGTPPNYNEIGDKCGWDNITGGGKLGGSPGAYYNQVINGDEYDIQGEYSNAGNTCLWSYVPGAPTPVPVATTTLPQISGTAAVGQTLQTTNGGWTNSPTSYAYQWQRCDSSGNNCVNIGTNASTYTLASIDVGHTIRVEVTASNSTGPALSPAQAAPTGVVTGIPSSTGAPAVTGIAAVGKILSTGNGSWSTTPSSYGYEWLRCDDSGANCVTISNAAGSTYQLVSADAGHTIRSEVSATNAAGSSAYVESAPTETVVPLPAANTLPAVSGLAAVGQTLSTTSGTWNTPSTYAYEWLRCSATGTSCSAISNTNAADYVVRSADAGHELEARVSATNAAGTVTSTSATTDVVIDVPGVSARPKLSGKPKVGRKLFVSTGTWTGSPAGFSYQWLRCSKKGTACKPIGGAHGAAYKVTRKDLRHKLEAAVTATNAAGKFTAHTGKSGLAHK